MASLKYYLQCREDEVNAVLTDPELAVKSSWRLSGVGPMPGRGWCMLLASLVSPVVLVIRKELVLEPPMNGMDKLFKCIY